MAKRTKPVGGMKPNNSLYIQQVGGETGAQAMARKLLEPHLRHALSASTFAKNVLGDEIEGPGIMDFVEHMQNTTEKAETGDLTIVSRMLAAQAITLDTMFTELAGRSALNSGKYQEAAERYGRLALKAQANSRATLEALAKLHQPREQIVKHVHVNEGGQAVVADQIHQHQGAGRNGKSSEQSHATGAAGECPAMLGDDAEGDGVPLASGEGAEALQNARRD